MGLASDIREEVKAIFKGAWSTRDGDKVPEPEDLKLANDGIRLDAVVLYADLADSTDLAWRYKDEFAAEVYKSYLKSACRIIRANGGEITAFDGDRVMAVYIDGAKNTAAAKTALQINWTVANIINPELKDYYKDTTYTVRQAVGIDAGKVLVARTGIRGSNDLVWVGKSPNVAAKLCALRDGNYVSFMTADVYGSLLDEAKLSNGTPMWEQLYWGKYGMYVYKSSYWWVVP